MRWRLIDRIEGCSPKHISGIAVVTLEATVLPEILGRDGVWPESLLLGALCELAHWSAAWSSQWQHTVELQEITAFSIAKTATLGERLTLELQWEHLSAQAKICGDLGCQASGVLLFTTVPLAQRQEAKTVQEDFEVLCAKAS